MIRNTWHPRNAAMPSRNGSVPSAISATSPAVAQPSAASRLQSGRRPASWAANTTTAASSGINSGLVAHSRLDWLAFDAMTLTVAANA
jgi:hypothetical protein